MRATIAGIALLLAAMCTPVPTAEGGEHNVRLDCTTARGLGLEVVRDLSDIGWCTVRGRLPLAISALGSEANGTWSIPDAPEPRTARLPAQTGAAAGGQAGIAVSDPLYPRQWGLPAIHAPEAWPIEQGDAGTVVAILDTGVDRNHADLPPLFDCISLVGSNCQDGHGHGTHVAGIVAMQVNGIGGVGVSPRVSVLAVKVLDDDGNGDFSRIAAGIVQATQASADIINMSFGGVQDSNVVSDALDYAFEHGVLLVAACGNAGQTHLGDLCLAPAHKANVLSVGAMNSNHVPAAWSSRRPDVLAPGVAIVSTLPAQAGRPNNRYASWSGTSMAAPHVSGAAALYVSARGSSKPQELMDRILGTTTEMPECDRVLCGAGLVNAYALLTGTARPTPTVTSPTAYPPPEEVTATPTRFFLTPTATATATVPRPTVTPTPQAELCTVTVNRVARSDSPDRWWTYVGASWANFLGQDGVLLESYVVSLPRDWWSLVLSAPSVERCGLWRSVYEELGYEVECVGACQSQTEVEAVAAINEARKAQGLEPLAFDATLWRAARTKAKRIADSDVCAHGGEIIGCGFPYPTAASMVAAWLDSPEHRQLLLCSDCGYIGISYLPDDHWYNVWVGAVR